jgi:hypothetical protein
MLEKAIQNPQITQANIELIRSDVVEIIGPMIATARNGRDLQRRWPKI